MNIFKAFSPVKKKEIGLPAGVQWQYVSGLFVPYDNYDAVFIDKAFKAVPIVQSIVSKISERAADATPQLMRIKNKREAEKYFSMRKYLTGRDKAQRLAEVKVKAFEQIDNHPFLEVMDNPNPIMSGRELRESSFAYLLITGNSIEYAAVPGAGGRAKQPVELWSIPSPCVKPVMSGDRKDPIKGYAVSYAIDKEIPKEQITHFKYFNPVSETNGFENSLWGFSPLGSSCSLLSQKKHADNAQGNLFANMGPSGILSGNSKGSSVESVELDEVQASAISDAFREKHMGTHNAGSIIVTPADVKWSQIGLSPVDMQILDFNKDLERQIANIYGYPSQLLQPQGVIANSEVGNIAFITNCVLPLLRKFDDVRTRQLRVWYNDKNLVYLSDTDVYPELETDKAKLVEWMRQAFCTVDEIRNAVGYSNEYDLSKVLVPSGLVPLSDLYMEDLEIGDNNE